MQFEQSKCRIVAVLYISDLKLLIDLEKQIYIWLATRPIPDLIMQVEEVYSQIQKKKII